MKKNSSASTSALITAIAMITVAGCATPVDEDQEDKSTTTAAQSASSTPFVAVPLTKAGAKYTTPTKSFPSYYWTKEVSTICGGDYTVKMSVEFGEVTTTSMHVNSVLVSYSAGKDVTVVPTTLDVYSGDGAVSARKYDELVLGGSNGHSHRYVINKTFPFKPGYALLMEFHSSAGLPGGDSGDFACAQDAQSAYYPKGQM